MTARRLAAAAIALAIVAAGLVAGARRADRAPRAAYPRSGWFEPDVPVAVLTTGT